MVKTRYGGRHGDLELNHYQSVNYRADNTTTDSDDDANYGYKFGSRNRMRNRKRRGLRSNDFYPGQPQEVVQQLPADLGARRMPSGQSYREDVHNEITDIPLENQYFPRRSTRRSHQNQPQTVAPDPPVVNGDLRRSSRRRWLMYGSFNQQLIDKELDLLKGAELSTQRETRHRNLRPARDDGREAEDQQSVDMYTRVKRERRRVKRDLYGIPITGGTDEEEDDGEKTGEDADDSSAEETSHDEQNSNNNCMNDNNDTRGYLLRQNKPQRELYQAPAIEPQKRNRTPFMNEGRSHHTSHKSLYTSPARKKPARKHRRRRAFHGSSSTSSSSSSDTSDDERRFQRRKAKSMNKSRGRCLPMNLSHDDVAKGVLRERNKVGASLADVDPMTVDKSVTFKSVGGLGQHIRALKEMIVFPLVYPEVFTHFKISPPRGVLFYGPPGTGKTLVARALSNECSHRDRRVAFFMRKGADCLSKWVGESERQLRLLFDQAYQMRPSIIFFDEIDGLAPVRSSKQDQIHSSIVSTLLALMDGLDSRGEVVVIGATNRIDAIDPALRRPGRFDREFLFPLPSAAARKQILSIHTREWNPRLSDAFLEELAAKCVGYCGADLKAVCTEAALHALRRRYPQIYSTEDKLQLDVTSIQIGARDFHRGMRNIVPSSQRAVSSPAQALTSTIRPLLQPALHAALQCVHRIFPVVTQLVSPDTTDCAVPELYSDDEDVTGIYEGNSRRNSDTHSFLNFTQSCHSSPPSHRPRLLISGQPGQGQTDHLAPALLHALEQLPVHVLDLPAIYAVSAKTPEESCAHIFREVRRTSPSILYLPNLADFWELIGDTLRGTFLALLRGQQPSAPSLLLATCEVPYTDLPEQIRELFSVDEVVTMTNPSEAQREEYFHDLILNQTVVLPPSQRKAAERVLEILPVAPAPPPRELTASELKKLQASEEDHLRELRLFLRDAINKLGRDRKFSLFTKPVDELEVGSLEKVPDYYEIIQTPMDLSTMMSKIDLHRYESAADFLKDIDLICSNALEYNPDNNPIGRAIRHRACALRDTAQSIITTEMDDDFEKQCVEISEARKRRGESSVNQVPSYYVTPSSFNRRLRGVEPLETITEPPTPGQNTDSHPAIRKVIKSVSMKRAGKKYDSPWCRPTKRRRRRVVMYLDAHGNQVDPEGKQVRHTGTDDGEMTTPTKNSPLKDSPKKSPNCVTPKPAMTVSPATGKKSPILSPSPPERKRLRGENKTSEEKTTPKRNTSDTEMKSPGSGHSEQHTTSAPLSASQQAAMTVLQQPSHSLVVDTSRLQTLLSKSVLVTCGCTIEQCERLYNTISQCIYQHRLEYDKTQLTKDLESAVDRFRTT